MNLEDYIERENQHLFGDGFYEIKEDDPFWLYETYQSTDNIDKPQIHSSFKNDSPPSYVQSHSIDYNYRPRLQGYIGSDMHIESYQNNAEKSWLFNLETHDTKLIIDDLDDNEIPEMLMHYDWVEDLEIDSQKIKKIKNLPINLKKLSLFNNSIETIEEGTLPESLESINLSRNKISILKNIPKKVKELDVSHNQIKECHLYFNEELVELNIESNLLDKIPQFNDKLKILDIAQNKLTSLDGIVDSIEELDISINKLENISKLPENLKKLNAFDNKIKLVPTFPKNIEHIDLSFNQLFWLPKLPVTMQKGDFSNNNISLIALFINDELDYKKGKLPEGNYTINISNNPLTNVPDYVFTDERVMHNKIIKTEIIKEIDLAPILSNNYIEIKLNKVVIV